MNGCITRDEKFHSLSLKSHYKPLSKIIQSRHTVTVCVDLTASEFFLGVDLHGFIRIAVGEDIT